MEILPREFPNNRQITLPCLLSTLAAACLAGAAVLTAQSTADSAKLTFTKVMKGSVPEYLAISVDASGEATYEGRKLDEPSKPLPMKLSLATTRRIFQLTEVLKNFDSIDLESHKKVANLGLKTFVYEGEGRQNRAEFNYTLRREAQELVDLFEKISSVEQHILTLEYAVKYDHLSLPKELMLIQIDLGKHALADPELMVPILEKIASNPRFLHLAQARAQSILQSLQGNN